MIKKFTKTTPLDRLLEGLNSDGIFIIDQYLEGQPLIELYDEVLGLCTTEAGHYELGRNYRGPSLQSFYTNSAIYKTYNEDWMKNLDSKYRKTPRGYCSNIFATHDFKPQVSGSAPNAWLHYDRQRCLKFFIYLTDIYQESGAFYCSPGSVKETSLIRKKIKNYPKERRLDDTFPEAVKKYPPEAVEGKAGTLIVFDTDCFHKGGLCKAGEERLVVRAHCKF